MRVHAELKKVLLRSSLLALAFTASCSSGSNNDDSGTGGDTCTQGTNMTSPALAGGLEQSGSGAMSVRILWARGSGRGAELPATYFDRITIEGNDAAAVSQTAHTQEREITLTFANLTASLSGKSTLKFSLVFPDRTEFILCGHPGMPDRYLLDVSLSFDADKQISGSTLLQRIELGDI